MENQDNNILTKEEIEKNREALKKRFETAANKKKETKKETKKEDPKLQKLKENPMYEQLEKLINTNPENMQKIINEMISKMTNDSKQKKNVKKQIKEMIEKIKEDKIDESPPASLTSTP
jgi:hypothetical protein